MKKVYLLITALIVNISCFATAWRTNAAGAANTLSNWRDVATGTVTPTTFATSGDTWTIQNNMTLAATTWSVAGSITINSAKYLRCTGAYASTTTINIGGNLSLLGSAYIETSYNGTYTSINLGGNLSMAGTSYMIASSTFGYVYFDNASSSLASPQTITWTSTGLSEWIALYVNS